jgi:hypothetical protein
VRSRAYSVMLFVSVFVVSILDCERVPARNSTPDASALVNAASPFEHIQFDVRGQTAAEPGSAPPGEKRSAQRSDADVKPAESETARSARFDQVEEYLWSVYQRSSTKTDSHGDFTWKDGAAAARLGLPIEEYVIGGADPDFRELLYAMGQAMDAAGVDWTILSAFRDDYRQSLAAGLKAKVDNSFHGGSVATGGYGHGCAADLASSNGLSNDAVWRWVDRHGLQFGLHRPLRAIDPAHLLANAGWHELAAKLRNERVGVHPEPIPATAPKSDADAPSSPSADDGSTHPGLSEDQFNCTRLRPPAEDPNQKKEVAHHPNSPVAPGSVSPAEKARPKSNARTAGGAKVHP